MSRKLVHMGSGPLFILCWPIFSTATSGQIAACTANLATLEKGGAKQRALGEIDLYGVGIGPIWLRSMTCAGDEGELIDCPSHSAGWSDTSQCSHHDDAGAFCLPAALLEPEKEDLSWLGGA